MYKLSSQARNQGRKTAREGQREEDKERERDLSEWEVHENIINKLKATDKVKRLATSLHKHSRNRPRRTMHVALDEIFIGGESALWSCNMKMNINHMPEISHSYLLHLSEPVSSLPLIARRTYGHGWAMIGWLAYRKCTKCTMQLAKGLKNFLPKMA